jgi:hypothetical protein
MYSPAYGFGVVIGQLLVLVLMIACAWKIVEKAGFIGAWSLLLLIPCVNIIAVIYFAFTEWPVTKAAQEHGGGPTGPSPYYRGGPGGPIGPGGPMPPPPSP